MTNRRTSNYTAHFDTPEAADLFARHLPVPVQDHGATAITYRAIDDYAALKVAQAALRPLRSGTVTLTTGLGVHRREVASA